MDEALAAAEAAAKNAKRAMVLTTFAVACAVLVLAIDHGIKRAILDEARNARNLFEEFKQVVGEARKEAKDGTEAPGESGASPSAPVGTGNGVVHDAPAGEVLGKAPGRPVRAPVRKPAGAKRGSPRNG